MRRLAAALAVLLSPTLAAAQQPLQLQIFADQALHDLVLQPRREPKEPVRLELSGGAAGAVTLGAATAPARPLGLFAGFGLGLWGSPINLLALRSELSLAVPVSEQQTRPLGWQDLEGQHRLRAQVGLGGLDGDSLVKLGTGVDTEVEASFTHSGRYGTSFLRRDVGNQPFRDANARLTLWPRVAMTSDMVLTMPVSAAVRNVHVGDESSASAGQEGGSGYEALRLASGLWVKPFTDEMIHGWFQFFGLSWDSVRFTRPDAAPATRLSDVNRLELKALDVDGVVGTASGDVALNLNGHIGGTWLWDAPAKAEVSAFTGSLAVGVYGLFNDDIDHEHHDRMGAGVGFTREGGFLADGSALTLSWRLEAFLETSILHGRVGGSARVITEQLSKQDATGGLVDDGFQGAVATEWYLAPTSFLQLGVTHTSTQRCLPGPESEGVSWCHRLGFFTRLFDREVSKRKVPEPVSEPPPPPEAPPEAESFQDLPGCIVPPRLEPLPVPMPDPIDDQQAD
jgi:hypothetical protein